MHPRHYIGSGAPTLADIVNNLNQYLLYDGYEIIQNGNSYSVKYNSPGNSNNMKNLIFAADGPKPEIVLLDTSNYEIDIVRNRQNVLVYDQTILGDGLTWNQMVDYVN